MPLHWSAYAIARTVGVLGVTFFAGSALTNAAASRLLVSDDALASVDHIKIDRAPSSSDKVDPKQAKRAELLDAALASQSKSALQQRLDRITENNIFCPACQPTVADETLAPGTPTIAPTELPLALLATMESDDPLLSMATIHDVERSVTGVYGLNEAIRTGVFVAGIRRGQVILRSAGGTAILDLAETDEPKKKKKRKNKKKKKRKRKRSSREIEGAREAIDCKKNACTIDRKFVEKLMANPSLLARQAKFRPAVKDGKTRGFRVLRVRRGTLPQLLGLKNGDTLLAVNGSDLNSMDRAMSLYTKLRRASELSLTVERKGKVIEKQISIR